MSGTDSHNELETGIEVELKPLIERIRSSFPDIKIFTERVASDTPLEMFYIEEGDCRSQRQWFDCISVEQDYRLYYVPDTTKIGDIQSRLRMMRRWRMANLMWLPHTKEMNIEQEDGSDILITTFKYWRRYWLDYPEAPKMRSLKLKTLED